MACLISINVLKQQILFAQSYVITKRERVFKLEFKAIILIGE